MDNILSKALREFTTGPLNQLIVNLGGHDGDQWEQQFKRFLRKEPCWIFTNAELEAHTKVIVGEPKIIKIERTKLFNPAEFISSGCSIWRGPKDGNGLKGKEDQDKRALDLTEVDISKIRLETMLRSGEASVGGEERLERLKKAGHIRLDVKIFQILWENQSLIPEEWKEKTDGNTTFIFFDGTILRYPRGDRCVLYLYWSVGKWCWLCYWLDYSFDAHSPSAVLAS